MLIPIVLVHVPCICGMHAQTVLMLLSRTVPWTVNGAARRQRQRSCGKSGWQTPPLPTRERRRTRSPTSRFWRGRLAQTSVCIWPLASVFWRAPAAWRVVIRCICAAWWQAQVRALQEQVKQRELEGTRKIAQLHMAHIAASLSLPLPLPLPPAARPACRPVVSVPYCCQRPSGR